MTDNTLINGICPYFTMYPLGFPIEVLSRREPRDAWVLDPFCGRGTTNLAARMLGLGSVGIDSSEVAVAIAKAKLRTVSGATVVAAARRILSTRKDPSHMPEGAFWNWAFHPDPLRSICLLREALIENCRSRSRIMLRAIVLGALHGPLNKVQPSYLSNQSPRTYAPKPAYAVGYWRDRAMRAPQVDVLSVIERRVDRYLTCQLPEGRGFVRRGDSRSLEALRFAHRFDWIVTSPPYYGMRTYIPDQWLRGWFLGGPDHVDYAQPKTQVSHESPEAFAQQIGQAWRGAALLCKPTARLVCRFGGIHDRKADPLSLARASFGDTPWRIRSIQPAGDASKGRRQSLQFKRSFKRAREEYDLFATLE